MSRLIAAATRELGYRLHPALPRRHETDGIGPNTMGYVQTRLFLPTRFIYFQVSVYSASSKAPVLSSCTQTYILRHGGSDASTNQTIEKMLPVTP